jgi:spore coat polysaccharide biosynthesis protein SpsF
MEAGSTNTVLILQARMGSLRLPGKSTKKLNGVPLLSLIFQRLERLDIPKWLATSESPEDDVLVQIAMGSGWEVFRGSDLNVLSRFEEILLNNHFDNCVRATGDNPLLCPSGISEMIRYFNLNDHEIDYMSDFDFGYYPLGAFAEIFSVAKFLSSIKDITEYEPWHFSHVTSWMRKSTRISPLKLPDEFVRRPGWRWTVDYPEDFEFLGRLTDVLGKSWMNMTYPEIVKVLDRNPELLKINLGVSQKLIELG